MRLRALLLLATATLALPSARLLSQESAFGLSGETWAQIDTTGFGRLQKLVFLRGVYDGLLFGRSPDIDQFPQDPTWDTLITRLDHFYSDFENRKVLVVWALQVLYLQMTGEPAAAVDSATAFNRCRAASLGLNLTAAEWTTRNRECAALAKRAP